MENTQVHRTKQKTTVTGYSRPTLCWNCQGLKISLMKLSSLLVLALAFLPHSCSSSPIRIRYDTAGSRSYTGRNCTEPWCNEKWRGDRILYYNYTVENKLVLENISSTHTINDCSSGSQISNQCETKVNTTFEVKKTLKTISTRSNTSEVFRNTLELDLDRLHSDNIDVNGMIISDTYALNQDKIWQLKIPKGCKMRVTFDRFEIESTYKCVRDYFSVQTSKDPEDVHVFCDHLSEVWIERRKRVQFKFHSDNGVHNGGIYARVCLQDLKASESDFSCNCKPSLGRRTRDTSLDSNLSPDKQHREIVNRAVEQEREAVDLLRAKEQLSIHETQRSLTLKQLHSLGSSHNQQNSS